MSYDKQTWQTGDVITANKLNHMEDGIASSGGGMYIINTHTVDDSTVTDNTAQEILDIFESGQPICIKQSFEDEDYYTLPAQVRVYYSEEEPSVIENLEVRCGDIGDWTADNGMDAPLVFNGI